MKEFQGCAGGRRGWCPDMEQKRKIIPPVYFLLSLIAMTGLHYLAPVARLRIVRIKAFLLAPSVAPDRARGRGGENPRAARPDSVR